MLNAKVIITKADAPWVVFLHGFGGSSDTWLKQVDAYSQQYNLLLLNFHIHEGVHDGGTQPLTVEKFCAGIAASMAYHQIERAKVVSISSGSLVALAFAALYPEKVQSMVLAGGMLSFNMRTKFLLTAARILQNVVPYMLLYKFFAYIIMPNDNHQKSRDIFVREAKKLGHREFCRWVNFIPLLKNNRSFIQRINSLSQKMPLLYIMGGEDHLFKAAVMKDVLRLKNAAVEVIPTCGHVCSIEKAAVFNRISLGFFARSEDPIGSIS